MATRKVASLLVDLTARTSRFRKGMDQARRKTKRFSDDIERSRVMLGGYAKTLIAVATTGAMAVWIKRSLEAADATAKAADKLGVATERLVGLRHAAEQTAGVTGTTLDTALQRMVRRISEAAQGTGEARKAIAELNLDAQALAALSPDEQFARVADAMQGIATQGDRVRLAMRLFDTEGVALVNTLRVGADGLERFHAEAEALGIALSRVEAAKVEAANDAIDRAQKVLAGVGTTLAVELAPYIEAAANQLAELAVESNGFRDIIIPAIEHATTAVGYLADAWQGAELVVRGFQVGVLKLIKSWVDGANDAVKAVQRLEARLANFGAIFERLADIARIAFENPIDAIKFAIGEMVQFITTSFHRMLEQVRSIGLSLGIDSLVRKVELAQDGLAQIDAYIQQTLQSGTTADQLRESIQNLKNTLVETDAAATGLDQLNFLSQGTAMTIAELNEEIDRLKQQPLASSSVARFVAELKRDAAEAAEEVAANAPAAGGAGDSLPGVDGDGPAASTDLPTEQERLQNRLQALREFGIAEREQLTLDYQLKQDQLRSALEQELITRSEYTDAEQRLASEHEQALNRISQAGNRFRLQDAHTAAGAALEIANAFGDKAIKIQKTISLVQSGISIATGIARAQELGFPANLAEAARVAALGVKVATTIKSASRSGSDIQMPAADGSSQAAAATGGTGATTGLGAADDPTAQIAAERDEQAQPGRLIIPDGVALDAR
ncbi:MAG: hypothetical protein ACOCXA_02845, partial [Planctomycetota bacterium]